MDGMAIRTRSGPAPLRRIQWRAVDYVPVIFVLTLFVPLRIFIGPIALSANRIFLLLMIMPCLFKLATGGAGRLRSIDFLIVFHAFWMCLAFVIAHGKDGIEAGGIYFVEAAGSYLVARCYIRTPEMFYFVAKLLFICMAILLPFLLIEILFGKRLLLDLSGLFGPTIIPVRMEPRMGLERAFGVFDHPILMGTFCGGTLSLTYYVLGYGVKQVTRLMRSGVIVAATATTLSSAPLLVIMLQFFLIGWQYCMAGMRRRWWLLGSLTVLMYIVIDLLSNRTPIQVLISRLTFNSQSAYWRIHIWNYGSAEVERHPWFGIGLSDWIRPVWMYSDSVDNFWLATAMRGGLPAFLFLAGGLLLLCISVGRLKLSDPRLRSYRQGWIFTMISLAIAACTVHYWAAIFYYFMFLIGSIVWLMESRYRSATTRPADMRS